MQSPFLGMDPYIESCGLWEDSHPRLIGRLEAALAAALPDRYVVRLGERAYVVLVAPGEAGFARHMTQGDVSIVLRSKIEQHDATAAVATLSGTTSEAVCQPVEMRALIEAEFRETFVEIYELKPRRKLVTTIEVLSPSNKRADTAGWFRYVRKRQAHFEGTANLVEIDLLRAGTRMTMMDEWPHSPYYVLVCRREKAPVCTVWPAYYTSPLLDIPVPLAPPDSDIALSIQRMITEIYEHSRYALDIDYDQPCHPQLEPEGKEWLKRRLGELGRSA